MKGNTKQHLENIRCVLKNIRDLAPITMRDLHNITHYSNGALSLIINKLLDNDYIVCSSKNETAVGRKSQNFDVNPNKNFIIGIDLNLEGVFFSITDLRGREKAQSRRYFSHREKTEVLDVLFSELDVLVNKYYDHNIVYIGVAMQGIVDSKKGVSKVLGAIKNWTNIPLKDLIEERYNIPARIVHDPDCLLKTETTFGSLQSKEVSTAMLVRLEKFAVGMAIMMNGQLYTGAHGCVGEIGRIEIPTNSDCGYTYIDWLLPEHYFVSQFHEISGIKDVNSYDEIVALAREGNESAKQHIHRLFDAIGTVLIGLINSYDPQYLVLYGEICEYKEFFEEEYRASFKRNVYDSIVKLKISELKHNSASIGAALWASDMFIDNLEDLQIEF